MNEHKAVLLALLSVAFAAVAGFMYGFGDWGMAAWCGALSALFLGLIFPFSGGPRSENRDPFRRVTGEPEYAGGRVLRRARP